MSAMSLEIDELLNEAIMTGVPSMIVEGIDDISIYESLGEKVSFEVEVYAIENIKGYVAGCEGVIKALEYLHQLPKFNQKIKNHILGIIDKDVRDYREDIPEIDALLILKYYSIESHFVSKDVLKNALNLATKASKNNLSQEDIQLIMVELEKQVLEKLYYFSLEALKNSLKPEYSTEISYKSPVTDTKNTVIKSRINDKKDELNAFAENLGIRYCFNTLKLIANGKWLIDVFSSAIIIEIRKLPSLCENQKITVCQYCKNQTFDKCLYRMKKGINNSSVKNFSMTCVGGEEFLYIVQHIKNMKN